MKIFTRILGTVLIFSVLILSFFIFKDLYGKDKEVEDRDKLVIYAPHPVEFIDPIIDEFERSSQIEVTVVLSGTGELLSRIENEVETGKSKCDVLWGGSFATINNKKELFSSYHSINEKYINSENIDGLVNAFSFMPSVIMVNENLEGEKIDSYEDLLRLDLKGKIAFANPALSASSYEQLINMIFAMGEGDIEKGWDYVEKLVGQLDGKLLDSSSKVYNGVAQGEYAVGLTFEEGAANFCGENTPIRLVYPTEGTIVRRDGVCIIKGSNKEEEARVFVDFVTGKEIQIFISEQLNRRSIRTDVEESPNLMPLSKIKIINDDEDWSFKNKDAIIERFLNLFNEASDD